MAFTTPDSMSGYQAPRRFLAQAAARRGGALFASTIGPLITPLAVVDALLAGGADIGPLDGYALDLLRLHEPVRLAALTVIASTPFAPRSPGRFMSFASPWLQLGVRRRCSRRTTGWLCQVHLAPP